MPRTYETGQCPVMLLSRLTWYAVGISYRPISFLTKHLDQLARVVIRLCIPLSTDSGSLTTAIVSIRYVIFTRLHHHAGVCLFVEYSRIA